MVEFALGTDRAAVRQHNMFGNGQPQSGSAGLAGPGFIYPVKTFEEPAEVLGGNARTEISNVKFDGCGNGSRSQNDTAAASSIFQRIVHKIGEDLMDCFRISAVRWCKSDELYRFGSALSAFRSSGQSLNRKSSPLNCKRGKAATIQGTLERFGRPICSTRVLYGASLRSLSIQVRISARPCSLRGRSRLFASICRPRLSDSG